MNSKNDFLSFHHTLLNKVLNTNGESLCILDAEKRYKYFNDTHKQLIEKLTKNQIEVGDSFVNLFEDENVKIELEKNIDRTLTGSELKVIQKLSSNGNGCSTVENTFIPFTDGMKNIDGIILKSQKLKNETIPANLNSLVFDFNKLADPADANNSNKFILHALNSLTYGIVITDSEGTIVWANDAVTKFSGFTHDELRGENPRIFKTEIHDNGFYEKLWQTIKGGKEWKGEIINRKKDGTFYFEEMIISPIYNCSNQITHFISIKKDITEQRQREKEIEKDSASLSLIVNKVPAVLWMVDTELLILSSQGSAMKKLGLEQNQVIGTTVFEFFQTEDREHPSIKAHLNALEGKTQQFIQTTKDGDTFEAQVEPLRDKTNQIIGCVGIAHNITDRVKYEKALIESREKAELSSKLKSEFLAQMSHEIRTPLNVIISSASLLKDEINGHVDEDVYTSFELIDSAGRRIIRTIDLLLNMSEIHTGSYDYVKEEFNLKSDVLEQVYENYKQRAKLKDLQLVLSCQTDDTIVSGDRYSILEIFSNLVDNAIKYTRIGRVEIIIDKDERDNLAVLIADTGIGISEDYLPQIFDKFTQEDEGYTRKFEGNGLGLALVKEYCDLNKLTVEVESEKGKGAIFKIVFKHGRNDLSI